MVVPPGDRVTLSIVKHLQTSIYRSYIGAEGSIFMCRYRYVCTHGILKQIYTGVTRREVIYLPPLQIDLFVFDKNIVCRDVN